ISIGSQRDTNIGTRNLIALQRPDLLERAFAGDVLFVPPIESDLPLAQGSEADGVRNPSTKFFMGPIRDTNRQIIAVMTLRVNPSEDLTQLMSSSKTRKTGETYTFSEHGELLSGSRFDEQLRRIGLIEDDQRSALNVAIRDPGVNLVAGRRAEIERSQQPLTRMASRAFQLKLDMENAGQSHGHSKIEIDTSGYRDYRGVPVFGAWLWDADVGLGLASEIDVAEAMSDYYQIRWTVFGVLAVTLLLSVGATMLVLLIGERTSQALRKSRDELELRVQQRTAELRKLSQATENSPASVVVTDKDGIIEYVNPIFCEVTGYSADEAIGQNPRVLKSGDLPESYYKELWDTILSGNVWRGEFVNKKKNGEEFWESASISPIKSEEGEVTHFVAVKEDITSRKQMENDLQERVKELGEAQSVMLKMMSDLDEEKQKVEKTNEVLAAEIIEKKKAEKLLIERENDFLKLVDNMPGSFWRVEHAPEWPVVYFSQGTKELSGYSAEEFMEGKVKWIERTHPEDLDRLVEVIGDAVERKEVFDITYRFIRADGQIRWVREIGIYFDRGGGNVPFLDGFVLDVHEQKLSEEELKKAKVKADEATRAKGDFLANMSHEIRTPMNAVIGMSHLALKTELTPKQKDYLNKIQSSANSLLGIINDILDFSKIEAGKLDMESVEFNLDDVLDNLANLVTVKAQEKEDLEVLFATGSEVPRFLVGDPLRLGQVLINLANNAVKFTDSGEIVVSTELLKQDEAGLALKFSVRDTGIGLTEEQIGKLFQSFSQADTSTTRKFGGTGLGLTISKRLVEMMGGDIGVESESGQGTTFSFTANLGLGKETVKKRLVPSSDLRGMKVLVVDDSATSRNILQDILESFTFDVTLAASAEEGLEEIQRADTDQPYEMVLMDWKMPGLDGLEASEQIKNQQNLSKIPAIILVTAYGREELMQRAEQIGLEGFLIKPIGPSVLFDTIMHAFGEAVPETSRLAQKPEHDAEAFERIRGANVLLVEDNEINQQVAMEILQGAG
ncbi:MAG: PAS domain S-box protein, partial [Deltaproteobacteria bacterium]|nr:PAS domain S-box protein [Deltaproteobacteria bacterium]